MIPHPEPCVKVRVGTMSNGRPIYNLPVECYVAGNITVTDGHWLWSHVGPKGYGQAARNGKRIYPHRLVYELLAGPIPAGLTIDHLCRVRNCVNPEHLEAVTMGENTRRGTAGWALMRRTGICAMGLHPIAEPGPCPACKQARLDRNRERRREYDRNWKRQKRAAS